MPDDLRYDIPSDDGDPVGPVYSMRVEFDEDRRSFYVADDSEKARAKDPEAGKWDELGNWREATLWLARQLLVIGVPVMNLSLGDETVGGPNDGSHPARITGSPSRAARTLSDEEILSLLSDPDYNPDPLG
jgi:hypothetical protein